MGRAWEWWKRIARRMGNVQARVLLTAFYFVVLTPFALAVRWGSDPLAIRLRTPRGWHPAPETEGSPLRRAARQF